MPQRLSSSEVRETSRSLRPSVRNVSRMEGQGTDTRKKKSGNCRAESKDGEWFVVATALLLVRSRLVPVFPKWVGIRMSVMRITSSAQSQLVSRQIGLASCSHRVGA